jgi:hypothetical protein
MPRNPDEILNSLKVIGGGDSEKKVAPPPNYKPLSVQQRNDWNNFLNYLDKKGVAGSTELDKRDKSLGLSYLEQYRKENPNTTITPDIIPLVQYEQYQLRKGDKFGDFTPQELQEFREEGKKTQPAFWNRPVSDVDNWLGSVTSKSYFPQGSIAYNNRPKQEFFADIENYFRTEKKLNK